MQTRVAQKVAVAMIVPITAKLHAAMMDAVAKIATITVAKRRLYNGSFSCNPRVNFIQNNFCAILRLGRSQG